MQIKNVLIAVLPILVIGPIATAQLQQAPALPPSLRTVPVPKSPDLATFVRDEAALEILGKALFWDMQLGSDGLTACASCHFAAGADNRIVNSVSPGHDSQFQLPGPNATLTHSFFPVSGNDRVSSAGVVLTKFVDVNLNRADPASDKDIGVPSTDPVFSSASGKLIRRVAGRNSPSVINAVFNHRNFWDGRAKDVFNGRNVFGDLQPAQIAVANGSRDGIGPMNVFIRSSSLASQAIGPPLSSFEMAHEGRFWQKVGKKMLWRKPLAKQMVSGTDSLLAKYVDTRNKGLCVPVYGTTSRVSGAACGTYVDLVMAAFKPEFWNQTQSYLTCGPANCENWPDITVAPMAQGGIAGDSSKYTLMEFNFPLFFGLAIQAYEAKLVSNDSKYDQWREGRATLSASEKSGLDVFMGKGRCIACHSGAELTNASVSYVAANGVVERMQISAGDIRLYDTGFYNLGVRPSSEDPGAGGTTPRGNPLSFTRNLLAGEFTGVDPCRFDFPFSTDQYYTSGLRQPVPCTFMPSTTQLYSHERVSVDAAFKTPGLRNVELTAPYFHGGTHLSLEQVVDFYDAGGGLFGAEHTDVTRLGLTRTERENLVAFLKTLTDERVRYRRAPFDHPQLRLTNGHTTTSRDGVQLDDQYSEIDAVGAGGSRLPMATFQDLVQGNTTGKAMTHTSR